MSTAFAYLLVASAFAQPSGVESSRPNADAGPTTVSVRYLIVDVGSINTSAQSFTADVFLRLQWNDPSLRLVADGPALRRVPLESVWHPQLDVWNGSDVTSAYADVAEADAAGNVTYRQRVTGNFMSAFELDDFPYDRQTLRFEVISAVYGPEDVRFVLDEAPSGIAENLRIPDWRIETPSLVVAPLEIQQMSTSRAGFAIEFHANRASAVYVLNMSIPLLFILLMAYSVTWLDQAYLPSKLGVCTGAIFSLIAFRFSLSSQLPNVGYYTRMDEFVFGATLLVFLPLGLAILNARLTTMERHRLVQTLESGGRWIYPLLIALLAWFTLVRGR